MTPRALVLTVIIAAAPTTLLAQYSYYYSDSLTSINSNNWTQNGTLTASSGGLTSSNTNGGSLISKVAVPGGTSDYEVKTTLTLTQSGGTYTTYLRASSNAMSGPAAVGTTYAFEVQNPTFSGSSCSATLAIYEITNGSVSSLSSGTIPCSNGMTIRAVYTAQSNQMVAFVNNLLSFWTVNADIASGQPGIGVRNAPSGNSISQVQIGNIYAGSPTFTSSNLGAMAFSNKIDVQWHGISEPNGPGIAFYQLYCNGSYLASYNPNIQAMTDLGLTPSTTYNFSLTAFDYHWNSTTVAFSELTDPTGGIDPAEVGVRPTGTYWGTSGENIDVRSGNLSYSLPLFAPQQRGGHSVSFTLSYNSQTWRQDSGGSWNFGADVGYGYGWRLQAGSLLPYYSPGYVLSEYTFIDATGAVYHLTQNNNGVWTSPESIYVWFNSNTNTLYFRDGSFWVFGATSAGTEQDAGTMYPTTMEDTNGNQISIAYANGIGVTWGNSSARISSIADVRATQTYLFNYNTDPIPHLTSFTNDIQTGEAYTFGYAENQSIASPISSQSFGTTTFLSTAVVNNLNATTIFAYDGSGEVTQVTLPYGGYLGYSYATTTYSATGISQREVNNRYLSPNGTQASQITYALSHESNPPGPVHEYTILTDPSGTGQKYWTFNTSGSALGLVSQYQGQQLPGPVTKTQSNFIWAQDANGNNYIGYTTNTLDPGQSYSATKATYQTLDNYGNVTGVETFNYGTPGSGSPGSVARTYNYTYLNSSAYLSSYIFNRLAGASVTIGSNTTTLATNYYDNSVEPGGCGGGEYFAQNKPSRNWDSSYASIQTRGDLTCSLAPNGMTGTGFDAAGNPLTVTVNGVTSQVTSTASNNYAAPTALTVGSLTTNLSWSSFLGLTNDTGPNGDSSSIYYDQYARQTGTTSPFGATTGYGYSNFTNPPSTGQTVTTTTTDTDSPTPPSSGRWSKNTLDGLGRTILTQSANSSGTVYSQAESVYGPCACSPNGKLMQQAMPHAPNATAVYTVYTYDGIGRTTNVVSPDGASTTTYSYQGNNVTVTDPAGNWKTFTMDALGNLTQVVEPNPANPGSSTYTTTYTYDVWNNLTGVSMPRPTGTQTRSFTYNGPYLLSATNPENGTVTYTYNSYNKVATKTDAKGQVVVYTYDSYARLTEVQRYPQGTNNPEDTTQRETYYYDSNPFSSTYSNNVLGRLAAVQYYGPDAYGTPGATTYTEMYNYNQGGAKIGKDLRVTRTYPYFYVAGGIQQRGTNTSYFDLNGAYTYDSEGRMTGIQYPQSGPTLSWAFDSNGHLNTMGDSNGSTDIISAATYGPSNQLLTLTGTYLNESRSYNAMVQLTNVTASATNSYPSPSYSVNISYAYSSSQNNGKITSQTDNISGEQVVYTYDVLNRLATAQATSGSWGQSYSYDGFGTLTAQNVIAGSAPTYGATPNPATNQVSTSDANGNALILGIYTLVSYYDVQNRFLGNVPFAGLQQGNYEYGYAPGNKRVWRGDCCGTDASGAAIMSTDEVAYWSVTGQKLATYQLGGEGAAGQYGDPPALTATQTATWYYFGSKMIKNAGGYVGADRLGSIGHFYPYGQEKPSATTNGTEKFTGYLRDAETGNDYAINRYHLPGTGRFLTPDPHMNSATPNNPLSWNRYSYTVGDPINGKDPTGLDDCGTDTGVDLRECTPGGGGNGDCTVDDDCDDGGCYVDDLVENPECYDPPPDPPDPPQPSPTSPPICSIEFQYHAVGLSGAASNAELFSTLLGSLYPGHGYLDIDTSIGTEVVEGYDNTNTGDLNVSTSATPQTANDRPSSDPAAGYIQGAFVCNWVALINQAAAVVNASDVKYSATGPNSSTALAFILSQLPASAMGGSWYTVPTNLLFYGWNYPQQFYGIP